MSSRNEAIIMLAKAPFNDSCKTRMAPEFDERQRQALSQAMIQDEFGHLRDTGRDVLVYCTPCGYDSQIRGLVGADVPLFPQAEGDLGQRMYMALHHAFELGYSRCVLVGSDVPELSAQDVNCAFAALGGCDVVLVPTFDGGYCLVGMNEPVSEAFPPLRYGGSTVLEQTVAALERARVSHMVLEPVHDIDTPNDLREFVVRKPTQSCPRTWAFARASI